MVGEKTGRKHIKTTTILTVTGNGRENEIEW